MDYSIFYISKHNQINDHTIGEYDLFFSGFDCCTRTKEIFNGINARKKVWLIFPQYVDIEESDYSSYEHVYKNKELEEDSYFHNIIDLYSISIDTNLCIDITGFIRPHLIYFIKLLNKIGIKKINFLYSEPVKYEHGENTDFTKGMPENVDNIKWCGPEYVNPNVENDLLIITIGYDDKLVQRVLQEKIRIKNKINILGFPSLQLDMYQESVLKLHEIKGLIENNSSTEFAPAMDPFMTAQTIHNIIEKNKNATNIYLCPISTKPHTLGIALYYLYNFDKKPISIIFPYSQKYKTKTAIGLKRIWKYTFELP